MPVGPPRIDVVFPDVTATVSKTSGTIAPGSSVNLRITVRGAMPVAVATACGTAWEAAAASPASPAGGSVWNSTMLLPDPLVPGERVLLRLTMLNGEIFESSVEELPIAGL